MSSTRWLDFLRKLGSSKYVTGFGDGKVTIFRDPRLRHSPSQTQCLGLDPGVDPQYAY